MLLIFCINKSFIRSLFNVLTDCKTDFLRASLIQLISNAHNKSLKPLIGYFMKVGAMQETDTELKMAVFLVVTCSLGRSLPTFQRCLLPPASGR
jgi:hypothetical protein